MTYGSLFSGIGGMDLGFDRAGLQCRWQVEIDDHHRRVLAKHWPHVPKHGDIKTFAIEGAAANLQVDLIAGGFPCQDLSTAGKRAGIRKGERSGLWREFARVIRVLRPRYVLVENVPGLLAPLADNGAYLPAAIADVLGELAEIGFDAEWGCVSAADFGAPHLRERIFLFAYPAGERTSGRRLSAGPRGEGEGTADVDGSGATAPHADGLRDARRAGASGRERAEQAGAVGQAPGPGADADGRWLCVCGCGQADGAAGRMCETAREQRVRPDAGTIHGRRGGPCPSSPAPSDSEGAGLEGHGVRGGAEPQLSRFTGRGWWSVEPAVVRMVHGVPRGLLRPAITGLGNAVVPQAAQWVAERIKKHARSQIDPCRVD